MIAIFTQLKSCNLVLFTDMSEAVIRCSKNDAWACYSLPGIKDHVFLKGSITDMLPSEGGFILGRWKKEEGDPLFISPAEVLLNSVWVAEVHDRSELSSTTRVEYDLSLEKTLDKIKSGDLKKAVISKIKVVSREEDDLYELFLSLKRKYPTAFTFIYHIPGDGVWCGATPEGLLVDSGDGMKTTALAGTLPVEGGNLEDVPWTEKERYEQGVIEDYVEDVLGQLKLPYNKVGPTTVQAGSVVHLRSVYTIDKQENVLALLQQLHPGPAICGTPKDDAYTWIDQVEGHDRGHYCGYLGPLGILDHHAVYIHLRSMRIFQKKYVLYLGGGITRDSVISSEWKETELKAQTMLSVINQTIHG